MSRSRWSQYVFRILNSFLISFKIHREITDIHELEQDKNYVERYQLVPVNEPAFVYEQNAGRHDGRSGSFER